jgi:hypothetical protein
MKAPWILVWALAAVPVFAQEPLSNEDRGAAFDLILDFVDDARADELWASRDAVDAARAVLMALRDSETSDDVAIADARENLVSLRRALSVEIRAEIGGNDELQAELRVLVQESRPDRVEAVAARRDENFDAVLGSATGDQVASLVENRVAIAGLTDELRSLREDGASRDDVTNQRDDLRALQMDQRDLVRDIIEANDDLRADLQRDGRETRRDARRDFRDSNDRFLRDRRDGQFGDEPTTNLNGG